VIQMCRANKDEALRQTDFFDTCAKCKMSCCSGARPPITLKRRAIIEDYLKKNGVNAENNFENGAYTFLKETHDNYCIFFDLRTWKCQIHPCIRLRRMYFLRTDWDKLKYPFTDYKILKFLDVLSRFEHAEQRLRGSEMVKRFMSKQDGKGRFTPESTHKVWSDFDFGQKERPSRWITFLALRIEKRVYR